MYFNISKTLNITARLYRNTNVCWTINNLLHLIQLLFCHRSTKQFASHIDNTTELPDYGSHVHTIFDTVATLPLYTVVCAVLRKIKLTLSSYCVPCTMFEHSQP